MINNIFFLMEALSVVLCIHYLYDEKFKLDIATVSLLAIDMILMQIIVYYDLSDVYTLAIYPIIVIYCIVKFGFKIKPLIINNILYMVIISGLQLLVVELFYVIFKIQSYDFFKGLIVNGITFGIVLFILPRCKLHKISIYLQDRERIFIVSIFICIFLAANFLVGYKRINKFACLESAVLFFIIITICVLAIQLGKSKIKSKEIEAELKMHKLYADSFQNLIENIRSKQHEFDNHINTIYNQHYMYRTYAELVNAQKDYCQAVTKENRYNKLLTTGNPVIIGFLYGKFMEIEKDGIDIEYRVSIGDLNIGIPVYKLVEILGNLIKNAVEELRKSENSSLYVAIIEKGGQFEIEVRNISKYIGYEEIGKFFNRGYSKKGSNRGLGLYNVKSICHEYKLDIECENKTIDNRNWLSFKVANKKETI